MQNQLSIPQLAEITRFFGRMGFSQDMFTSKWSLIQLAILLSVMLIASLIANRFGPLIEERLRAIEGQRGLLRFLALTYRRMFSVILALGLWLNVMIMRATTWPSRSYLLGVVASLVTAWVVISIASRVIKNRVYSRIIAVSVWIIVALFIIGMLPQTIMWLDTTTLGIGPSSLSILSILKSLLLLGVLSWLAILISQYFAIYLNFY